MSLVNDMLRDLDARRRDGPSTGAERLIPVSSQSSNSQGLSVASKVLVALGMGGFIAALILVGIVFVGDTPSNEVPQAAVPAPVQRVVAQPDVEPARGAPSNIELERMAQRLNLLEQQNQLLQQQAIAEASITAASSALPQGVPAALPIAPVQAGPNTAAQAQNNLASMPVDTTTLSSPEVQNSVVATGSTTSTEISNVRSLTRSPSELSFRDQDRLQVQRSLELWQGNQRAASLDALRDFTGANIEAHQSREMLGKLLLQQGNTIESLAVADMGLQIAPDYAGYKKLKARILMAAGVPKEATLILQSRGPSLASDSEYHELLAASQLASKEYDAALYSYRALVSHEPEQARWWYGQAASFDALGRGFEAAQSYERSLRLEGLSPSMRQKSQERLTAIRQN